MRRSSGSLLAVLLVALACARTAPSPPTPPPPRPFLQDRAWSDLEQLAAIGERPSGSVGAEAARSHVRGELAKLGIEVRELALEIPAAPPAKGEAAAAPTKVVHLVASIPGESSDVVLIGASYDGPAGAGPAADAAASAPALVLELARAIAARPLPYTTWLVFLDGDLGGGSAEHRVGSGALARQLAFDGDLQRIRLALWFQRVAAAELRLQRDLLSHRPSREALWRAAARHDAKVAFAPDTALSSPPGGHLSLFQVGVRRAVIITGAGEPLDPQEDTIDRCSPQSLATVGQVVLDGLDDITRTMIKVDRLAPGATREEPPAEGAPEAGAGAEESPGTALPPDFVAPAGPEAPQSE